MSKIKKKQFDEYLQEIEPSINFLASRLCRKCAIEFEEAKQEMTIAAWKAYQSYDPSISKFSTYSVNRMHKRELTLLHKELRRQAPLHIDDELQFEVDQKYQQESAEDEFIRYEDERSTREKLDEIQYLLKRAVLTIGGRYKKAYDMFVLRRNEMIEKKGKYVPLEQGDACEVLGINTGEGSDLWSKRVKILATAQGKASIVEKIKKASEKKQKKTKPSRGGEKSMAKTKSATKKSTSKKAAATTAKGRTPRKGGLHEKIEFVNSNFVAKGLTRPDAVQGLLKKYPDMSENYARTIVYSQMKEYKFESARGKAAPKAKASKASSKTAPAKKSTSKKSSKKTSAKPKKAAPVDEADDFDDF